MEKSENCSETEVLTQQKKRSGKPHTSPYLPDIGKHISEACKAVQPFHSMCQNRQIIHELKKTHKCSKGKQQIKYICLCNSPVPLPETLFLLYFARIQCKLLGAHFIFRALWTTLWKHPSVSLAISDPYSAKTSNFSVAVSCLKTDEMKVAFCTQVSSKGDNVTFMENVCCLQSDRSTCSKAQFRIIRISLLFSVGSMR